MPSTTGKAAELTAASAAIFRSQEKSEAMIVVIFSFSLPSTTNHKGCIQIACFKDLEQSPRVTVS